MTKQKFIKDQTQKKRVFIKDKNIFKPNLNDSFLFLIQSSNEG